MLSSLGSKWMNRYANLYISSHFLHHIFYSFWWKCWGDRNSISRYVEWKKERKEGIKKARGMLLYSPLNPQPNATPITNTVDIRFASVLTQTMEPSIIQLTTFNIYSTLQDMIDSFIWCCVHRVLRTTKLLLIFHKTKNQGSTPCRGIYLHYHQTERVSIYITLFTSIRDVFGSNFGRGTQWLGIIRSFPQSLQENYKLIPWLGNDRFLPNPFQFIHLSSYRSPLCNVTCRVGCAWLIRLIFGLDD